MAPRFFGYFFINGKSNIHTGNRRTEEPKNVEPKKWRQPCNELKTWPPVKYPSAAVQQYCRPALSSGLSPFSMPARTLKLYSLLLNLPKGIKRRRALEISASKQAQLKNAMKKIKTLSMSNKTLPKDPSTSGKRYPGPVLK